MELLTRSLRAAWAWAAVVVSWIRVFILSATEKEEYRVLRESIEYYRNEIDEFLPMQDDNLLLNLHERASKRAADYFHSNTGVLDYNADDDNTAPVPSIKEEIRKAFTDVIELNWNKCRDLCRESLDRARNLLLRDNSSTDYWTLMRKLQQDYLASIGNILSSKMQFVWLEYLEERLEDDYSTVMKEKTNNQVSGAGDGGNVLQLRMTWGMVLLSWKYWNECRVDTSELLRRICKTYECFENETVECDSLVKANSREKDLVDVFLDHLEHEIPVLQLQFIHVTNNDFRCYKVLLRKLHAFLRMVKSAKCFKLSPRNLFQNITTFEENVTDGSQNQECSGQQIIEEILQNDTKGLGITAQLHAYMPRTVLHLDDLLRKLAADGELDSEGMHCLIDQLQNEHNNMTFMFSDSFKSFMKLTIDVETAADDLRKTVENWLQKREETINQLNEIIEKLHKMTKDVAIAQTVGSSVGIAGGAVAIAGLVLAPLTLGISLGLTIGGGVAAGLGAATGVGASISEIVIDKGEMEKAMKCLEEDKNLSKEVEEKMEKLKTNSGLLFSYIPPDELLSLLGALTDPHISTLEGVSAPPEVVARITINVTRFVSIGGKAVAVPVSRMAVAGTIAASRTVAMAVAHSVAVLGVALDIANLVLSSRKLATGAKSENAKKLEDVVEKLKDDRTILDNYLNDMK